MKLPDCAAMGEIDRRSREDFGIPGAVLMENAGIRCWDALVRSELMPAGRSLRLVFLAGGGNNGGDALVMARQALTEGHPEIVIVDASEKPGEEGSRQREICRRLGMEILSWKNEPDRCREALRRGELLVDGLAGTGLRGGAREPLAGIIREVSLSERPVAAVDLPSGLGDGWVPGCPAVRAELTLTIGLPLRCLYLPGARSLCGRIEVVPIAFPRELTEDPAIPGELVSWEEAAKTVILPPKGAHKNRRGHAGVFAGAPGTLGAALLASEAAARSLAGLTTLFAPRDLWQTAVTACRSVMTRPWDPRENPGSADLSGFSAVLAGPGWGRDFPEEKRAWLDRLFASELPGVLDADGLRILARTGMPENLGGRWIFTPHPGEMSALTGLPVQELMENPLPLLTSFAEKTGTLVVFKASVVYIVFPDGRFRVADGENPALATGGSGDILAGIITGLLASGNPPETAATAGACLHQELGRRLFRTEGWFLAQDLLPGISRAWGAGE